MAHQSADRRLRLVAGTDVTKAVDSYVCPTEIWTGHHAIDATGATVARDMLLELRSRYMDDAGINTRDYCDLQDWARQGRPFRNIVLEYLRRARCAGDEVEAGFCAALTDFVAWGADPDNELADPDSHIRAYVQEEP